MRLSGLTNAELKRRIGREGLDIQIGPYVVNLQSSIPGVIDGVAALYADYPLLDGADFKDFYVRIAQPPNLRRWFRPQVSFVFDGAIPFKPLPLSQAFPFFEWGLNWCIAKHSNVFLILHAAVIERNGKAIVMPGPPGAGKSTLCAGLVARGWRLLSDELALVSLDRGTLTPVPRPISLKNESIGVIAEFAPAATIGPRCTDTSKGTVAHMKVPFESIQQAARSAVPAAIVLPHFLPGATAQLQAYPKSQAFMHLARNAFNYNVLGETGFRSLAGLIDSCDSYAFTYSSLEEAAAVFQGLS